MTEQTTSPVIGLAEVPERYLPTRPRPLPYSAYPRARDVARHGLQPLPRPCRSWISRGRSPSQHRYSTVVATDLTPAQLLRMAWVIGASFARREPQARHLRPPKNPPAGLMEARHSDPFGTDSFGPWDTATHMYWIVRLFALTDPTSPADAIEVNEETLAQSVAILDREGRVIGSAFNETMPPFDVEPPLREDDPFLDAVVAAWEPVYAALGAQDAEALTALSERYPAFREAYGEGKVSHHLLIARSDDLPKGDAFELVAASAERLPGARLRVHGHRSHATSGPGRPSRPWAGYACTSPRSRSAAVPKSAEPLEGVTTSPNGFLSDKDSGGMFYVIRLA